jgi:hypothetical protein
MENKNIQSEVVQRELKFIICEKCGKKVTGTSNAQLGANVRIHNIFCKKGDKKNE